MMKYILTALIFILPTAAFAQANTRYQMDVAKTEYVISDDAVFVYYFGKIGSDNFNPTNKPVKFYDFATRHVYIDVGGLSKERDIISHSFDEVDSNEIMHIKDIACAEAPATNPFKRFCKDER